MKNKLILSLIIVLLMTGCKQRLEHEPKLENKPVLEEVKKEEKEINQNPISLALYEYNNGSYIRKSEYISPLEHYKDIAVFSVIYTNTEVIGGYSFKDVWKEYYNKYDDIADYKLGYEISFTLKNGKELSETILKPLDFSHFSFSNYLYIWLYDDINQTANWYSHLEENEYTDQTVMSSIKLMAVDGTDEIETPIKLTAFTYKDANDFNEQGKYIGNSKFTTLIKAR